MKFKYILPALIGAVAACLIGGTCYGLWVFNTDKTASTEIGFDNDGDSNIKIDDIAENYYFASDTKESNFYNDYFFSQPRAAQYETSSNTPVEEYDKETKKNSFSYHNAYLGYWGTRTDASSSNRNGTRYPSDQKDSDTNDGTMFGYKKFTNVYKRLSSSQFSSLGNCFSDKTDNSNWYNYFAGFTCDTDIAITNDKNKSDIPQVNLFDLSDNLSKYDADGDRNIYLYAIYTNGKDYARSNKLPAVHLVNEDFVNVPGGFQWTMLPSTSSSWSLSNSRTQIPFYYALKNIQVVKNKPTDSVPLTNVYYLDRTYRLQTSRLVANNTSNISGAYDSVWDGWNSTGYDSGDFNINISNLINEKLDNGCTYNFYVYYDQIVDTSIGSWGEDAYEADEMLNTSVDSLLKDKNLIYASDANKTYTKDTSDKTTYNTGDQLILQNKNTSHCTTYMKIYIERVYDYKFVGDITISLDYSNGNGTVLPLTNDVTNDSNINNFYSNEIILPSSSYVRFGVNYGSSQTNNTVTIDSSADGSGNDDICYMPDSTTQYVNPSKQKVFYDQGILRGNIHPTDFSNPQNINVFEVINPGVYRFRIKVTYENGLPSSIKLSAAYIRGVFTEIFTDNPTDNIGNTKYVDHATYNYRLDNYYDNDLTSSSTFYSYGNHNASYSFSEVVSAGKVLIDHVLGSDVVIDPHNLIKKSNPDVIFRVNGKWESAFKLKKNYIFYEVDPSTID